MRDVTNSENIYKVGETAVLVKDGSLIYITSVDYNDNKEIHYSGFNLTDHLLGYPKEKLTI